MRKLLFLLPLLFCGLPAFAQNHDVTANLNVVDSAACANNTTTANSTLLLSPLAGDDASAVVQLSGTFSATAQFQGTGDGANWVSVNALPLSGTQTAVTSATSAGAWRITASGLQAVRVCLSVYASGKVQANITSSAGPSANGLGSSGGGSGTVTSVATTSPITGGPITTSGTIACATCAVTLTGQYVTPSPLTGAASGTVFSASANVAGSYVWFNPIAFTTGHLVYSVGSTADNTSATYDVGMYSGSSGGTCTLLVDIGPTAGTTFAPGTSATHTLPWAQGSTTIPAGRLYVALTTSQTVTPALLVRGTINTWSPIQYATNNITVTTGGTLPSTVTCPTDAGSPVSVITAAPYFAFIP